MVLLTNINAKQLKVLNTLIHKVARTTIGYHSYRWSNCKVLSKCNWLNATQLIVYSILNVVHKVNIDLIPPSILDLFLYSQKENSRFVRTPTGMRYEPKGTKLRDTSLYRGVLLYNKIREDIKVLTNNKFKAALKVFICEKMPLDRINTYRDYI